MRLVCVQNLCGGEIIGKDILTAEGGILLRATTKFRPAFKEKLLDRGITEIFIEDKISEGIEPPEIISQDVKTKLTKNLKNQFETIQNVMSINLDEIHSITHTILENMTHQDLILDMMDLKRNDSYTYSHCLNVCILSCAIARKMGFKYNMLEKVVTGAILHDIGKMVIPKDVLNKPGKLTVEERVIMESHSKLGYDLIKDDPYISPVSKVIILCHHERENGNGYPLKKGCELHAAAKIVAVADVFDALISDRPYRVGFPLNQALSILKQEQLNQDIISTLENMVAFYPVGCTVRLNNNHIGLVEQNYCEDLKRPSVRVIYNLNTHTNEDYKCHLINEPDKYIVERLDALPTSVE